MDIELAKTNICEVCRENVLYFYELLTQKEFQVEINIPEEAVYVWGNEDALQLLGLADTGMKPVREFSLGMKQRLGIARAVVSKPELLILDVNWCRDLDCI